MNCKTLFQKSKNIIALPILLSLLILPVFSYAVTLSVCTNAKGELVQCLIPCGGAAGSGQAACTLSDLVTLVDNVINFALFYLAAPLAVLSIAIGGLLMITARGDTGQLQRGKDIFYNTVIGFLVAFGAYLIVEAVIYALTGNPLLESWLYDLGFN